MSILIVGNILKDIYLNLDSRTENFETDKNNIKWLELSFDASKHFYFGRNSSFGGAAISLEVLKKFGLEAKISDSELSLDDEGIIGTPTTNSYRYILVNDENVTYLTPSELKTSDFVEPESDVDYIFIDRSALLDFYVTKKISSYLNEHPTTKLIIHLTNKNDRNIVELLPHAALIFYEEQKNQEATQKLISLSPEKTVFLTENHIRYLDIVEKISLNRINLSTHLSVFSIISATILGSFLLGNSVEKSLKLARLNAENSRLDTTLSLNELESSIDDKSENSFHNLELIAKSLVLHPKGILAADESGGSIKKKFASLNIEDTYENRRDYRNIFFTTPNLEKYVNGVILFDETARQFSDDGRNFVDFLTAHRIIPGIKVDGGLEKFENSEETYTKGLDGLSERLKEYRNMGLRFAKWRAAFEIRLNNNEILTPSNHAIEENCRILAEYAKKCQENDIVPIVEPEVVYDGDYDIEKSAFITGKILDQLFNELNNQNISLPSCILKVNMILAGKKFSQKSSADEIGQKTSEVLKSHVPENLAGVVFLSGGQSPEEATRNLAAVLKNGPFPWPVTFSFARALQDPALYAWNGNNNNIDAAHEAFLIRLIANSTALKTGNNHD